MVRRPVFPHNLPARAPGIWACWVAINGLMPAPVIEPMLRGSFRRTLVDNWYLVSAPIITANRKAKSGEKWLLPLGGGICRRFVGIKDPGLRRYRPTPM